MSFLKQTPVLSKELLEDLKRYVEMRYIDASETVFAAAPSAVFRPDGAELASAPMHAARDAFDAIASEQAADSRKTGAAAPNALPRTAVPAKKAQAIQPTALEDLLRTAESSFSEHLLSLLNECGEKDSAVYRRAEISRQLFHRILSNKQYQPTKSTAIQLALGLRLDLPATQTLLEKAGYSLTRSSKADLVVQYFIEHEEYSIITINTALYDCGLPLLKTGSAN